MHGISEVPSQAEVRPVGRIEDLLVGVVQRVVDEERNVLSGSSRRVIADELRGSICVVKDELPVDIEVDPEAGNDRIVVKQRDGGVIRRPFAVRDRSPDKMRKALLKGKILGLPVRIPKVPFSHGKRVEPGFREGIRYGNLVRRQAVHAVGVEHAVVACAWRDCR